MGIFPEWAVAGGAVASLGFLAMFWGQVRTVFSQLISRWVFTVTVSDNLQDAVGYYIQTTLRPSRVGHRCYSGWQEYVWRTRRKELVAFEVVGGMGRLYWSGWVPMWVNRTSDQGEKPDLDHGDSMKITILRGTIDLDDFMIKAADSYNKLWRGSVGRRFQITYVNGTAGDVSPKNRTSFEYDAGGSRVANALCNRPINYTLDDLRPEGLGIEAIKALSLSQEAEEVVERIRAWITSESWCRARGIPWQMGVLLSGPPGTGKTSLSRALAEDLDLPIYVFDLASLRNSELRKQWESMSSSSPCVALIEDVDSVFHGRENVSGVEGSITFDCLLNCIDGVSRNDGILLILTTNDPSSIDSALASSGDVTRPGRINVHLEMGKIDHAGRRKMAYRILEGLPGDIIEGVVQNGEGDSPAQFQERCLGVAYIEFGMQRSPSLVA